MNRGCSLLRGNRARTIHEWKAFGDRAGVCDKKYQMKTGLCMNVKFLEIVLVSVTRSIK